MKLITIEKTYENISFAPSADGCVITAVSAVEQGAAGCPYHADGQLCRLF